ncbi:MAG: hypothetical protein ACK4Y7_05990 [Caldimicrobium sp.]
MAEGYVIFVGTALPSAIPAVNVVSLFVRGAFWKIKKNFYVPVPLPGFVQIVLIGKPCESLKIYHLSKRDA